MKYFVSVLLILLCLQSFGSQIKAIRIIDGDTFEAENGERIRLIGINAPEITDIFGNEAKIHLSELIEGKMIDLLTDHISNDRDKFGRLLRYIFLSGVDINKKMLLDGYAFAYLKYHFDKENEYINAQLVGKHNNQGIWNNSTRVEINRDQSNTEKKIYSTKFYLISALIVLLVVIAVWSFFKR